MAVRVFAACVALGIAVLLHWCLDKGVMPMRHGKMRLDENPGGFWFSFAFVAAFGVAMMAIAVLPHD